MTLFVQIALAVLCVQRVSSTYTVFEEIKDCPSHLKRDDNLSVANNRCYTFHHSRKNFLEAEQICRKDGGLLATPKHWRYDRFLKHWMSNTEFRNPIWVGLNDKDNEHKYIWSDGSELDVKEYENFEPGEGINGLTTMSNHLTRPMKDCVAMHSGSGKWFEDFCDDLSLKKANQNGTVNKAFVCEYRPVDPPTVPIQKCPSNLNRGSFLNAFSDRCYNFHDSPKDFQDAEEVCKNDGGYLVTIKSKAVNRFLQQWLKSIYDSYNPVWIGLNDQEIENTFEWSDGTTLDRDNDYENFKDNEGFKEYNGNIFKAMEDCITMEVWSGKWKGHGCYEIQKWLINDNKAFVCEFETIHEPTTPVTTAPTDKKAATGLPSQNSTRKPCQTFCDLDCGLDGYVIDETGCMICECDN